MTAADWADYMDRNRRANAEYEAHPVAGRFNDNRQTPCATCQEPTYSQRGLCAACRKGER